MAETHTLALRVVATKLSLGYLPSCLGLLASSLSKVNPHNPTLSEAASRCNGTDPELLLLATLIGNVIMTLVLIGPDGSPTYNPNSSPRSRAPWSTKWCGRLLHRRVPRFTVFWDTIIELSLASDFSPALFFARDEVLAILERYVRAEPLELVVQSMRVVY